MKFVLALAPVLANASTIDFSDLPDANFFNAGDQNIGSYYAGLNFGPDVTALDVSRFGGYDNLAFPPHSGDVVIWDPNDATITISFSTALTSFGIWFTTIDPITLQAYDAANNLLGAADGNPNTDGTTGSSSFLSFTGLGIQSVQLASSPGLFVLSDLSYEPVPEPAPIMLLVISVLSFSGFGLLRRLRQPAQHRVNNNRNQLS